MKLFKNVHKSFFLKSFIFSFIALFLLNSCGLYKKTDNSVPVNALERARQNVEEGKGASLGGLMRGGQTTFEFSTSNPLWRASLETLDFIPLSNVDYSGGIITTDWYNNTNDNDSIKITIRFLSNEVKSDSLKIIVHQKKCQTQINCSTKVISSKIEYELRRSILAKAALLEKNVKNKKN